MSSGKTEHYSLHQWEAGDNFLRGEFNENFAQIDAAVAGKASIAAGSYTGDGKASRFIDLGFTPKAVLVVVTSGLMYAGSGSYGGLAVEGFPANTAAKGTGDTTVEIVEGGFRVYQGGNKNTNSNEWVYQYVGIG